METEDIVLVYKVLRSLKLNEGLVMEANNQSIAIVKRKDERGIYYSINDKINNVPQKPYHDQCAMMLLLLNKDRFLYSQYKSSVKAFM